MENSFHARVWPARLSRNETRKAEMARILQAAFTIRALSHSPRVLKVTWGDGAESTYPSTWLRASVRDPEFFDSLTCEYLPKHFPFISKGLPIVGAEQTEDEENVEVVWDDHTSCFNIPWLRVQDSPNSRHLAKPVVEEVLWTRKETLPQYDYSEKDDKFEAWMKDLLRWGVFFVHGCPTTDKGLLDFMQMIGIPLRRKHPSTTGVFKVQTTLKSRGAQLAYSIKILEAHTDEVVYSPLPRLSCLLSIELDAPVHPTKTFVVDAFKVIQDLRQEDPEAFEILRTTPYQLGRHRMSTEEDCDPSELRFYEWDSLVKEPIILTEGDKVKRVITRRGKSIGLVLGTYDEKKTLKFYSAYQKLQDLLNNPHYRQDFVLYPGTMVVFDNYRLCHGRLEIHPSTSRLLKGLCIPEDGWRSRWRLLLGRWSGIEPQWCHGCSDEALNILAQRKLESTCA